MPCGVPYETNWKAAMLALGCAHERLSTVFSIGGAPPLPHDPHEGEGVAQVGRGARRRRRKMRWGGSMVGVVFLELCAFLVSLSPKPGHNNEARSGLSPPP